MISYRIFRILRLILLSLAITKQLPKYLRDACTCPELSELTSAKGAERKSHRVAYTLH